MLNLLKIPVEEVSDVSSNIYKETAKVYDVSLTKNGQPIELTESGDTPEPGNTPVPSSSPEPSGSPDPSDTPDLNVLYGDMNDDGIIDASDALLILKIAAQIEPATGMQLIIGDVDGNGFLDANDALQVLKRAAQLLGRFPVEEIH